MQPKQLEYLVKAAECGSITQAAEQLFVSQPSLTKAIMSLEQEYDVKLLIRRPRGIELTAEGRRFVYYARSVITAAEALERSCKAPEESVKRLFLATQQLDFVYNICLEVYAGESLSNIHFNIAETDRADVVQQVLDRRADLGLFVRNRADAKNFLWNVEAKRLEQYVLDSTEPCVCVGPQSPYYDRAAITLDEAQRSAVIALDMEEQAKQSLYFDNVCAHYNEKQIVFVNTVNACEYFLMHTDALAYLSEWAVDCFQNPTLRILRVIPDETEPDLSGVMNDLLWIKRAGELLTPTERQFIQRLYAHFGQKVPMDVR